MENINKINEIPNYILIDSIVSIVHNNLRIIKRKKLYKDTIIQEFMKLFEAV